MRVGVVTFPGSCDDRDAAYALELLGMEPVQLWHAESDLHGVDAVVLPGGFSHGDYLRTGALARFAPVMAPIAEFAAIGGPVLGICNGFQILCEAGLLPGALTRNANLRFVARPAPIRLEKTGAVLTIPVKHGEGRYVHDDPEALAANGQVLARYLDDPNGSVAAIAGVTNPRGNVAGLMPHPEHAVDPLLGPTDGRPLLTALLHTTAA